MKKFLFILLICTKIVEIICGDDEASPSKRENKGKRQMEEHSDSEDSSKTNSDDFTQKLLSNPATHGNLEDIISPDINLLKALETTINENVPQSPIAKQLMENDTNEKGYKFAEFY